MYWKESGYGDQFAIVPAFNGTDDTNTLCFQSAVGAAGTTPNLSTKMVITGKNGNVGIGTTSPSSKLDVNGTLNVTGNATLTSINGVTVGSSPKFTDTTYSSKAAASGGTAVSLCTTGEKYNWNVINGLFTVATKSVTGAVSIAGTTPVHVLTATGNISSITLSANPAAGHNCHVIITATAARTVVIAHDATNRVCPGAADVTLSIPANGYVEIDFLTANGKVYVRGV